jgi:hypothetical protein
MNSDKMETDKRCAWKHERSETFPFDASLLTEKRSVHENAGKHLFTDSTQVSIVGCRPSILSTQILQLEVMEDVVRFIVMHRPYVTLRNRVKILLYWAVILNGGENRGKIFICFTSLVCDVVEISTKTQAVISEPIP